VVEGRAGSRGLRVSVGLSAPSTRAVSFHYATSNGTASSPSDYAATSGTGTIGAGGQSIALTVPIVGNQTSEPSETFRMTISAPVNGVIHDAVGVGTILNDDPPASGLRVSIGNASIEEGRTGNRSVVLTVTLSAPSGSSVTVHFASSDGTATSGGDYVGGSGTVTIPAGNLVALLSFSVRGDSVVESNETFRVTLSSPVRALLGRSQGTATIINDD
jgi:chitinase